MLTAFTHCLCLQGYVLFSALLICSTASCHRRLSLSPPFYSFNRITFMSTYVFHYHKNTATIMASSILQLMTLLYIILLYYCMPGLSPKYSLAKYA